MEWYFIGVVVLAVIVAMVYLLRNGTEDGEWFMAGCWGTIAGMFWPLLLVVSLIGLSAMGIKRLTNL